MHNGLTRVKTKSKSGEWQQEDMHETTGNVVRARQLIDELGADLFRYFILSTHYRRPIDFEDDVIAAAKKGFNTFLRLLERVERLTGQPLPEKGDDMDRAANNLLDGPHADFARNVLAYKMKFLEAMDDDFNTAGAIAVMHELAGEVNSFVERTGAEKAGEREKRPELVTAVTAAAMTLRNLLSVLGMFRVRVPRAAGADTGLADELMSLLIQIRNDARRNKNFAMADAVRDGLKRIGVTLEDRAEGTTWRKE
jgi:cysteinyl-tRNA synthetase